MEPISLVMQFADCVQQDAGEATVSQAARQVADELNTL
jgi:hypothetical protein